MSIPFLPLVASIESLGSLPAVHHQLTEAMEDPCSSLERFGQIIEKDPDLTARLLRVVNSSIYGFPRKIDSVSQAITLIGVQQIRNLVSATVVIEFFNGISSGLVEMDSFWRHSVACALAAKNLASYRRDPNPERHFVAGLVHDIGRLVLYLKAPDRMAPVLARYRSSGAMMFQVERELLGFDHAEVGAALLHFWRFPENQIAAVRYHHAPLEAEQYPVEAALVHLADIISLCLQHGHSGQAVPPAFDPHAWSFLGLPNPIFESLIPELDRQFHETANLFLHEPR